MNPYNTIVYIFIYVYFNTIFNVFDYDTIINVLYLFNFLSSELFAIFYFVTGI